jgi:hypothetical protein
MTTAWLLGTAAFLAACTNAGSSATSMQIRASGGSPSQTYSATLVISGQAPERSRLSLPWTSRTASLVQGTFVSFSIATTSLDASPVTCQITADHRIVSRASAARSAVATCSGRV